MVCFVQDGGAILALQPPQEPCQSSIAADPTPEVDHYEMLEKHHGSAVPMASYKYNTNWRSEAKEHAGRRKFGERGQPKKRRPFCTCGTAGCKEWRDVDQFQSGSFRCLCGLPFTEHFVPKKFLEELKFLVKKDEKDGKKNDNKDKAVDDDYDDDNDSGNEPAASTPQQIQQFKEQPQEEEALADKLRGWGLELPMPLVSKIKDFKERVNGAVLPAEVAKSSHAKQQATLHWEMVRAQNASKQKK